MYYANNLKEYLDENKVEIYTSKKADIPTPEFYVIYTGERKKKPQSIKFSEEFFIGKDTGLEITIKMLYGEDNDIIGEYVAFTKVFDEQRKIYGYIGAAVEATINICKDKNILNEYIEGREGEILDMMYTLYD